MACRGVACASGESPALPFPPSRFALWRDKQATPRQSFLAARAKTGGPKRREFEPRSPRRTYQMGRARVRRSWSAAEA